MALSRSEIQRPMKELSETESEAYYKEMESQYTPQYALAEARYRLKTHMLECLDPDVIDGPDAPLFWACLERGGTMAVYNECLEKGCTISQLFGVGDDVWDRFGGKPTIESRCYNDPQLIKDYLTMLEMQIDLYDGIESFDDMDEEKSKAMWEFYDDLKERMAQFWAKLCKGYHQAHPELVAEPQVSSSASEE